MEPRAARPYDLPAAAAWLGLEAAPRSWAEDLETGAGFAVEEEGALAGLVLLRCFGRVVAASLLLVHPARRGRGHGRRLVAAAREELLRRDAHSFGLEADPFDQESLAALLRLGFKAGAPLIELDWELESSLDGESELEQPPLEELAAMASALDAGFEPGAWVEGRRLGGARLLGALSPDGDWRAAALVEAGCEADAPSALSLVLIVESEPFEAIDALGRALAAGGLRRVRLGAPARQADALRAFLLRGARPRGLRLRLSFPGFPERSDLRRALFAPWR